MAQRTSEGELLGLTGSRRHTERVPRRHVGIGEGVQKSSAGLCTVLYSAAVRTVPALDWEGLGYGGDSGPNYAACSKSVTGQLGWRYPWKATSHAPQLGEEVPFWGTLIERLALHLHSRFVRDVSPEAMGTLFTGAEGHKSSVRIKGIPPTPEWISIAMPERFSA
ncbi:hypothetical protein FA13DRAFT_1714288 [Coprinellus micaceus]|uniref:Uncharacterized protein n=1 Tax=Coprinellus micaceus TaxID=71717 RepID=A0A4Y7ST18_COPMI|nr:hypothetical protein FA13DRAFT_1714288 [Coprinellus micaceus]